MARTPASVAASRIRIEDEVWEEAFSSRVPSRRRRASGSVRPARPSPVQPDAPVVTLRVAEPPALPPPETRRTVRIQGRGADPYRSDASRRSQSPYRSAPAARSVGASPDRLAMWAALLGFLLVVVAILSSHF
ncbi:MAG TPA: hypothetical protein VGF70_03305 [Solirubrobacteraceae bacterium]|jgi:hypothetical protein